MADSDGRLSDALAARYAVLETLGEGAMGTVYRAVQVSLDRPVALKVIRGAMFDADARNRFLQEAKLAAKINHPHVVQVYESGETEQTPFIAFELVNGPSLRKLLDGGPLDPLVAAQYTRQVALGLAAAHDQGIVHRDVKPENILITQAGDAKIADFGISRPARDDKPALTATGTILGSPLYMSPEQAKNQVLTGSTDQYSLGVVLFEMLVGRPPFEGSTGEVLAQHLRDEIRLPAQLRGSVPATLVEILEIMVRKEPSKRFPHVKDLAASLERVIQRWKGPRKSTMPVARPRGTAGERVSGGMAVAPAVEDQERAMDGELAIENPRVSAARSAGRSAARSAARSARRMEPAPGDVAVTQQADFEREPLPMGVRVVFAIALVISVSVIAFSLGRRERPPPVTPVASGSAWPAGTILGNLNSKIYHIVGVTKATLPGRINVRQFASVEEAERAGYRRSNH